MSQVSDYLAASSDSAVPMMRSATIVSRGVAINEAAVQPSRLLPFVEAQYPIPNEKAIRRIP